MAQHSIIPPSSASIWAVAEGCRGWVAMAAAYPAEDTEESREGTVAHAMATGWLSYKLHGHPYAMPQVGELVEGVEVTHDMRYGALMFADYVLGVVDTSAVVERPVRIHTIHELCEGTPDVVWFARGTGITHVFDYKFGWGPVEADENPQCLLYALGAQETWGYSGSHPAHATVRVHIIQPRAMHYLGQIRTWLSPNPVQSYLPAFRAAATEALSNDAQVRTGPFCRHCTARHACGPALDAGMALYESLGIALPVDATVDQIAGRWAALKSASKRLEKICEAYEAQFTSLLQQGHAAREYRLAPTQGNAAWVDKEAARAVAAAAGVSLEKNDLITPTQAKAAGLAAAVVDSLSLRKPGLKIQKIDHRQAEEAFK